MIIHFDCSLNVTISNVDHFCVKSVEVTYDGLSSLLYDIVQITGLLLNLTTACELSCELVNRLCKCFNGLGFKIDEPLECDTSKSRTETFAHANFLVLMRDRNVQISCKY